MDEPQSPVMSDDMIPTPHDSDIKLIENTSTYTSQSSDFCLSLPAAPSWWLKAPAPRFLAVSDTNPDSLAKA